MIDNISDLFYTQTNILHNNIIILKSGGVIMKKKFKIIASSLIATTMFSTTILAETIDTQVPTDVLTSNNAEDNPKISYTMTPFNVEYQAARPLNENLFVTYYDGYNEKSEYIVESTIIDKNGKIIIPPADNKIDEFTDGYLKVGIPADNDYGYTFYILDEKGNISPPLDYTNGASEGLITAEKDGKMGYIDMSGNEIVPFIYAHTIPFKDGMGMVVEAESINMGGTVETIGYVDKTGKLVIPTIYDQGTSFYNGVAVVGKEYEKEEDPLYATYYKYGLIKDDGTLLTELKYDDIQIGYGLNEELYLVESNSKYGYINRDGVEVIPCIYDEALAFGGQIGYSENLEEAAVDTNLALVSRAGKNYFVNTKGEETPVTSILVNSRSGNEFKYYTENSTQDSTVDDLDYDFVSMFRENIAQVRKGEKSGAVDRNGAIIVPLEYDYVSSFNDGLARVGLNDKYGVINAKGEVITPIIYDSTDAGYCGVIPVLTNSKWGCVDATGNLVVPAVYDEIYEFKDDRAIAVKDNKYGVIDTENNILVPFEYDDVISTGLDEEDDVLVVQKNGKWGVVDFNNNTILPLEFDEIGRFQHNLLIAKKEGQPYVIKFEVE